MIKPKAFRGAGLIFESRNDSGRSLATTATCTAATASDPEGQGEAIVHRGSTFPKDTCTSTSSTCVPPKSSAKPKAGKGWGGFLGNIFRSVSPTSSNSGMSVDSSVSAGLNDRQVPSPIGDIGFFAHPDEDNSDPCELVPAPPAPPRRAVSDAPFRASAGASSSPLFSSGTGFAHRHNNAQLVGAAGSRQHADPSVTRLHASSTVRYIYVIRPFVFMYSIVLSRRGAPRFTAKGLSSAYLVLSHTHLVLIF